MRTVPRSRQAQAEFFRARLATWTANAAELGIGAELLAALTASTNAAVDALEAQREAENRARAATAAANDALAMMNRDGSAVLKHIRAKAGIEGEKVYAVAQIAAPAPGAPTKEPGEPTNIAFTLDALGAVKLTWNCDNPRGSRGTMYQVSRRIGADGPLEQLGTVGKKMFRDDTLPANGAAQVTYLIQAIRSTGNGPQAMLIVNFGMSTDNMKLSRLQMAA